MDTSGALQSSAVVFKGRFSPKKLRIGASPPPFESVVDNNGEEKRSTTLALGMRGIRLEKNRQLAAALLQRQAQLWLLQRQETLRSEEVTTLHEELRKAAVRVIEESYGRYVKRRSISKYLQEIEESETKVGNLLQICIVRKRRMEEVHNLRLQLRNLENARKRRVLNDWLSLRIQTRREHKVAKAHELLIGWIRRWKLWKRCEVRADARKKEIQEEHQRANALRIVTVYRAYLCRRAKEVAQHEKRMRDGMTKLCRTFRSSVLRTAQFRWVEWSLEQKTIHEAAGSIQRIYRGHQASIRYSKIVISCQKLQRVLRGHQARVFCKELRRLQRQKARECHAATVIQRLARGHLTRLWFRGVLVKLRERFRCGNCGVVEPGGTYCKYCGRHRPSFVALANVLMFHEKWQQRKCVSKISNAAREVLTNEVSVPVVPSPKKPTLFSGRPSSLRLQAPSSNSIELLTTLPAVMLPHHRRFTARDISVQPIPKRRNSIASISEQTALRAMAIADLQVKFTTATQVKLLEMHLNRQQKAYKAINR
ncbi:hypothetical protein DVH05_026104 [Phytophthora capsici]|nr:hypothetical protein DVH05_026104 [Phytophthora capsici]